MLVQHAWPWGVLWTKGSGKTLLKSYPLSRALNKKDGSSKALEVGRNQCRVKMISSFEERLEFSIVDGLQRVKKR